MRPNRPGKRDLKLSAIRSLTQRTQRFSQRSQSQKPPSALLSPQILLSRQDFPGRDRLWLRLRHYAFLCANLSVLCVKNQARGFSRPSAFLSLCLGSLFFFGCDSSEQKPSQQRYDAAKALFEQTTKSFHIPAAEAKGAERRKLLEQAAAAYGELLGKYPEQDYWAAQALRSLGNIRAAQTNVNEAINYYATVEKKYPQHDFEVLMAWKSAADLLWETGRHDEAKGFYQKIVARFGKPEASQVVKTVVRGSTIRLTDGNLPGER